MKPNQKRRRLFNMRKNLTEIVFILDRSGSMEGLEKDTIGGYNSFLQKQRKVDGEAYISTVLFDTGITVLHDRQNIKDVKLLTDDDYVPGGLTALLDAVGGAIKHIGNIHKYARSEDVPEKTMFVITTDGYENSSKRYDYETLNTDYMWPDAGTGVEKAYGSGSGYSLVSFFGKANYTYADKYLASVTIRRDGSSRFGKNNKYGTFPSVSLGWRVTQENFMKDTSSWLYDLKLRASWGQTGNQEISNTARYTLYQAVYGDSNFGGNSFGTSYDIAGTNGGQILQSGFKRVQIGNDDIKWETTTQTNLGVDFSFFNNTLYGSFDYYRKNTKDILLYMAGIAAMGEGCSMWINAGEMKNNGVELNLGYRNSIGDFSYDITANLGTYRNEITKLPETVAANGDFGGNGVKSVIGHPMGAQVGYVFDGIFKSQEEVDNHATQPGAGVGRMRFKDLNGDGMITEADQDWIYSPVPDFSYGFNIYLQYKNWDLTMFWQGVQGVDVISDLKKETDLWAGVNVANLNKGQRLLDAWSPTNPDSTIPALSTYNNNNETRVSSYYVENGSFLKLRNIQIGYNVPKAIANKLYMERLRFYLSAQNLLTVKSSSFTGVDPENANFGYPIPVNMTFGLNVTF